MSEIVPGSVGPSGDRPNARDARANQAQANQARANQAQSNEPQVGFGTADPLTAGLLSRYLVGRVVAARLSVSLLVSALILLAGAVALWEWGPRWLGVLVGLFALAVFTLRALAMAILRRVMGVGRLGPVEDKVRALVADSRRDLSRELRRIGLPGSLLGMPLLVLRLIGRRRAATFARLKQFDVNRVVPRSRQDELHFLVTSQLRRR